MKRIIGAIAALALLTGCTQSVEIETVYLATHDSFVISEELIADFESQSGYQLEIVKLGDTGSLTSKLVVTKQSPVADAVYGIDNTFLGLAKSENIFASDIAEINFSDVCFNYDVAWFKENQISPPKSWRELGEPQFKALTVVTNPLYSSPGLAFLATTHAGFETSAQVFEYWRNLRDNQVKVAGSWEDAYFVDFTRYGGNYPIVLSYASSPAAEVDESGNSGTAALLEECFRQTEYAAVLANAKNPNGAQAIVDFLLSKNFQQSMPESMYVYPAHPDATLPEAWSKHALPANSTIGESLDISENRDRWLTDWQDVFDN
ncbi:MAG: hypothetical protein RLZZ579_836 [Actinomycetota bacterium]